jgi:hypothetical protein
MSPIRAIVLICAICIQILGITADRSTKINNGDFILQGVQLTQIGKRDTTKFWFPRAFNTGKDSGIVVSVNQNGYVRLVGVCWFKGMCVTPVSFVHGCGRVGGRPVSRASLACIFERTYD